MVNPLDVVNYSRNEYELQEFMLFCIFVANKNAIQTAYKLDKFLENKNILPFQYISNLCAANQLENKIKEYKLGQYKRIGKALVQIIKIDLSKTTRNELLQVHGIGLKTASYFISCTQKDKHFLVLDTHISKALKVFGICDLKSIPSLDKYLQIEEQWLKLPKKFGIDPAEFDLNVWKFYAGHATSLPNSVLNILSMNKS